MENSAERGQIRVTARPEGEFDRESNTVLFNIDKTAPGAAALLPVKLHALIINPCVCSDFPRPRLLQNQAKHPLSALCIEQGHQGCM